MSSSATTTPSSSLLSTFVSKANEIRNAFETKTSKETALTFGGIASLSLLAYLIYKIKSSRQDVRPKMVLVTGAGSGLGRAMTLALLKRGDTVVGADVDAAALEKLAAEYSTKFIALPMNVADATSVKEAAARLERYSGGKPCLDAIVNNAGILRGGPLVEMADNAFAAMLAVNIAGTFHCTKYFFPLLRRNEDSGYRARVINLGSEVSYSRISAAFNGPYAMTKFSIEAYSAALRQEFGMLEKPVYVTIVCPGAHATEMTATSTDATGSKGDLSKSLFKTGLIKGGEQARHYIDTKKRPASDVGDAVARIVHLYSPPMRKNVNVSWEMFLGSFVPQFVLDAVVVSFSS